MLIFTSAPDSRWSKLFFAAQDSEDEDHEVFADFVVQCATPIQAQQLEKKGIVNSPESGATLAIIDSEGTLVSQLDFPRDDATDAAIDARIIEFLASHRVKFPDAKETLDAGLAQAATEDKRVLIQMSGPSCAPCVLLSQFLTSQEELLAKDYVYVKLDRRMHAPRDAPANNASAPTHTPTKTEGTTRHRSFSSRLRPLPRIPLRLCAFARDFSSTAKQPKGDKRIPPDSLQILAAHSGSVKRTTAVLRRSLTTRSRLSSAAAQLR